jgi:hypothetical protein
MTTLTDDDETRKNYEIIMGPELGPAFYVLFCEVSHLHEKWGQYVELFAVSEERIVLLNRAAQGFFGSMQNLLWNDIILHIARINDSPRSAGRPNLTLSSLVEMATESGFRAKLISQAERARHLSGFCRDWRNRRLAHTDFELATRKSASPLETANRLKVREALAAIADFMNTINSHFQDSAIMFLEDWGAQNAQDLLHTLNDGLHLEDLRLSYVNDRKIVPDNLRPGRL